MRRVPSVSAQARALLPALYSHECCLGDGATLAVIDVLALALDVDGKHCLMGAKFALNELLGS